MDRPLLRAPRFAAVVAVVCWAVLFGMAAWLRDSRDPTSLDASVGTWLYHHVGTFLTEASLVLSEPVVTVGGCAAVTGWALITRRWNLAVLASVGPLAGLLLESHVLKPAIDRRFGIAETLSRGTVKAGYAYPSGHETGLASLTTLLVIVLLGSAVRRNLKIVLVVLAALWTVAGAFGLVRNAYHYFTDTLGGIALGVGLMVSLAWVLDVVGRRVSSPAGRGRARTARAV